jgi:hypothetical protein
MPTFTIDTENNITVFASSKEIQGGRGNRNIQRRRGAGRLGDEVAGSTLSRNLEQPAGRGTHRAVTSRQVAVRRIWKAIQRLQADGGADRRRVAAKQGRAKKNASRKAQPAVRENSKTARVIALLRRPTGASLKTIMRATGWQAHSVRGFISGQLGKKMGLKVRSSEHDGERVYEIKS